MPAVKLQKFQGAAPKQAPELLADTAAQVASNVKLYSGDLIPYRYPSVQFSTGRSGEIQTIYPMRDTTDGSITEWLSWAADVDVATAATVDADEQRVYYTGDGVPKVTNYKMAVTDGGPPYPYSYYELGLPLPSATPSASAAAFSQLTVSSYARDSGYIATLTFGAAHGLKSGAVVTVSGFNDSATISALNSTNVTITVTSTTAFTYYNVGAVITTASADTDGRVNLSGNTTIRNYLYTWMTPWGEESVPSEPSTAIYLKEGQVVTVSSLPNTPPGTPTYNFIRGIRLYRTVASVSDSAFLRLCTIWFPVSTATAERTSNVVTLTMADYHNLSVGDRFKTTGIAFGGVADTSFDVTDGTVLSVTDDYTFTYTAAGSDKVSTATSAGSLQFDVSEPGSSAGTYYSGTTFTDNYDVNGLVYPLESEDYDAPDSEMVGLISTHNNILAGFVGNEVCFSEPSKPWAWPTAYRQVFPDTVVGLAALAGYIVVMTTKYPYLIDGLNPASMQYSRIDTPYPCASKRGIVSMPTGVVYPTHGGLAAVGAQGVRMASRLVHDWDTWDDVTTDHASLVGEFYAGKYFVSDGSTSIIFEEVTSDESNGGTYVTSNVGFTASYYDAENNRFYYVADTTGDVYEWDNEEQPFSAMEWKSKKVVTQEYINIGAARVIADYDIDVSEYNLIVAYNAAALASNVELWTLISQLGAVNAGLNYTDPDTLAVIPVSGAYNTTMFNGDPLMQSELELVASYPLSFRMWVEGELVFDKEIINSDIFRLPTGYRSDTFEVAVSGSARVKAIYLGETPTGLRTA